MTMKNKNWPFLPIIAFQALSLAGQSLEGVKKEPEALPPGLDFYAFRSEPNKSKALDAFGGSVETERAVDAGLRWLAKHQEPQGNWDSAKYGGKKANVGITGLALLAFLGAECLSTGREHLDPLE